MESGEAVPELPEGADKIDQDLLLRHLDDDAQAKGRLRPDLLFLLRKHGALANGEMARKLGGDGSERIVWCDDRWHLNFTPS